MKNFVLLVFLSSLCLIGCNTRTDKGEEYTINGKGLSGLGRLKIGDTQKKVLSNLETYEQINDFTLFSTCKDYDEEIDYSLYPEVSSFTGVYQFTENRKIGVSLFFFENSLELIDVNKEDIDIVLSALSQKYGEGIIKKEEHFNVKYWYGKEVSSKYLFGDVSNYGLKVLSFSRSKGDVWTDVKDYVEKIDNKKDGSTDLRIAI